MAVLFFLGSLALIVVLPAWVAASGIPAAWHALAHDRAQARRALPTFAVSFVVWVLAWVWIAANVSVVLWAQPPLVLILDTLIAAAATAACLAADPPARDRCVTLLACLGIGCVICSLVIGTEIAVAAAPIWVNALAMYAGATLLASSVLLRRLI